MKKYFGNRAFTLIEMMIAVAIIGIIAAVAIPSYHQYVIRSRVLELVHLASGAKAEMAEYIITNNAFPGDAAEAGISLLTTNLLASMTVNNSGMISLTSNSATVGADLTINLQAVNNGASVAWICTSVGEIEFAPSNCR